jgi:hypothetical protein
MQFGRVVFFLVVKFVLCIIYDTLVFKGLSTFQFELVFLLFLDLNLDFCKLLLNSDIAKMHNKVIKIF